ncbi:SEC-C domain-containing protein [Pelagibacterium luteolum]|uniref:SEC-C motif-containing protein n=1 Tax=Pelagibacterium luteolum TaxID=440168 RepID=A0A1G7WP74_9HYPH|nr:SEC-C domain-containing protein [Pelagibacterium luteolum]SDG73742.1 SEC-C motif-containing protein [Pelagibacterium luteolum]
MAAREFRGWKPKWSAPCPCASEKKYKNCCHRRLPSANIGKAYSMAIKDGQLERALLCARADITQYTIWHKSHTAPLMHRAHMLPNLLQIDVDALGAYVGRLFTLYLRLDLWSDWRAALGRLRGNIEHDKWYRKVGYYLALSYLGPKGDRIAGRRELAKLGPITNEETDLELLQIYVDLEFDDLAFADRMSILDRILQLSEERSNQMQYRTGKAIQYYLIDDRKTAGEILDDVVARAQSTREADPFDVRERHLFAGVLQLLGSLRRDADLMRRSTTEFEMLLEEDCWTDLGRAKILRELGDTHRYAGNFEIAEQVYRDAVAIGGLGLDQVYVAECLLRRGLVDRAVAELEKADTRLLVGREFEDYTHCYGVVALAAKKMPMLNTALNMLKQLKSSEPVFNTQRLELLVNVTDMLAGKQVKSDTTAGGLGTYANFLILQPSLFGFGINFNAIIDYLSRKKPKSGDKDPS